MPTDTLTDQTAALRALGGQRVWSLMISLFGDLAREEGDSIEGPLLSAIMQGLEVKPEATRVALHRLRKEGWLTSTKSGRISSHAMTAEGRAQSAAASPRIYAEPNGLGDDWQLVMLSEPEPEKMVTDAGYAMIAPRVFVGPIGARLPQDALVLSGASVPAWLIKQAEPAELTESYAALLTTLDDLQASLGPNARLTPVDIAILRCLIVHNWRRLVLKHPMLPRPLIDPDGPGHQCHLIVWDLLGRFPRPALADLEKHHAAA